MYNLNTNVIMKLRNSVLVLNSLSIKPWKERSCAATALWSHYTNWTTKIVMSRVK